MKRKTRIQSTVFLCSLLAIMAMTSCSLFENEDDLGCSSISTEPLTEENLNVRTVAYFREAVGASVDYFPGDCIEFGPQALWEYSGDLEFTEKPGLANSFMLKSSGTLCAEVTAAGVASEQICKDITVYDENVWGVYQEDFPGGPNLHQVTMNIAGDVYSGFGLTNRWFRLDTTNFIWEEKAGLPNLIDFTSYGGFSLEGKGYIVGNNSQYYSYDPVLDSWTDLGTFSENVRSMLGLGNFTNPSEFSHAVVGLAYQGKGYFGLGRGFSMYEYDPMNDSWLKLSDRPERTNLGDHSFALNDLLYQGDHVYDFATDSWRKIFTSFSAQGGYSPGFAYMDGELFGGSQAQTIVYREGGFKVIEAEEDFNFFRAPIGTFGNAATTGRFLVVPCPMRVGGLSADFMYYVR